MVRLRLAVVVALLSYGTAVEAQPPGFTGSITGHLGAAHGGDVGDPSLTPGGSMAVIDDNGVGVELDVAHTPDFDKLSFVDSSITSLMLNVIGMYPHPSFRPFAIAGVGVIRTRAAVFAGQTPVSRTELGFSLGGGLQYMFNELIGVQGDMRYFRYFQRATDLPIVNSGLFEYRRISFGVTLAWPIR